MAIAHKRDRQGLSAILAKMKFSPVVSIQGPRQCGKSFLARELIPTKVKKTHFVSLDEKINRNFAENNPSSFLGQGFINNEKCLIIDEAQKAPDLFDEIKAHVDLKRIPGQFLLLGSTEFSLETKIRESLTGRLSRFRLYPFNISETLKLSLNGIKKIPFINQKSRIQKTDFLRYLKNGGFPEIFSVKSELEQRLLFEDWINLTCERDIHQIKKYKLDSDFSKELIAAIAILESADMTSLSKQTGQSTRKVERHIKALLSLFVIFEVKPHKKSKGKSLFYLTDTGLLH